jgi:hypothetical protein
MNLCVRARARSWDRGLGLACTRHVDLAPAAPGVLRGIDPRWVCSRERMLVDAYSLSNLPFVHPVAALLH